MEVDDTRSIVCSAGAAAFLRRVLPTGVATCETGEFCCLRYSWRVKVCTGVRDEVELLAEWCGECNGVTGSRARARTRGECEL